MLAPPPSTIQVSVSMKFNGASAVQVRTPRNVADLAAYTSLKLYITPSAQTMLDNSTQFIFYLGNKNVSIRDSLCLVSFLFSPSFFEIFIVRFFFYFY